METLRVELPTRRSTTRLARALSSVLAAGDCLTLNGPLGVGKTFLTRALCRALGLPTVEPVTSPTFTLVNEHPTVPPVAHADVYRLDSPDEVRDLGLAAMRGEGRLVVVEWGEPFVEALGGDAVVVRLEREPRGAEISATGERSAAVVDALRAKLVEGAAGC